MNGIEWLIIVAVIAIVISFSIAVEGDSVAAGLFGVFVIICFLGLVFLDGGVRGANLGCAEISSPPGLLANMPYDTLAIKQEGNYFYALVRPIDGRSHPHVRCVKTKQSLPSRFSLSSDDKVVPLGTEPK